MDPLWRLIETYHSVVYYAPERGEAYRGLGLKGGWMGYFASRAGALGRTPAEVVAANFYNFHPAMVGRALPEAWTYTTPEAAVSARLQVFDGAVRRLLGSARNDNHAAKAADLAAAAVASASPAGRPLFAAHRALPQPPDPHLSLFWATTALREFRGDGHNAALLHAGVDGCAAHVLMAALGLVPADQREYRGWSADDWTRAQERLRRRGWLQGIGLSANGRSARAAIERDTDRLAEEPISAIGPEGQGRLAALLGPIVERLVAAGGIPYPNGIGVPRGH